MRARVHRQPTTGAVSDPGAASSGSVTSPLPFCYRVTKYNPADRDERGHYTGTEDVRSDHGAVEAAYLAAVAAFAEDSGVRTLSIREPAIAGLINFGIEPPVDGHGLAGLFPADLTGYHDGAQVPVAVGLELVRAMLRDNGAWCRLEVADRFSVHVGWDQYVYVSSASSCDRAVATTHGLGLFAEPIPESPYLPEPADPPAQAADDTFWQNVADLIAERGPVLLEEGFVQSASRWHRLTADRLQDIRAGLTPRARLLLWPDLSADIPSILTALPTDGGLTEVVWEDRSGTITGRYAAEENYPALRAELADARAATVLSIYEDERHPLMTAVLPDPDGVLRARWTP
jgi:small subunit ribosomal protein S1